LSRRTDPSPLARRIEQDLRTVSDRSVATVRKTRRRWSSALRQHTANEVLSAGLELFEDFNYRWVAYELILFHPSALSLVGPAVVERLAGHLESWGDVDQFGILVAGPAWRAGQIDDRLVHEWASRPDRWWRRAALVATVPLNVRSQGGSGDVSRTLGVCQLLLDDRDDMVTKALSWALRELVAHDRSAVEAFLAAHDERLAARVRREVRNKLATGLKNPYQGSPPGTRRLALSTPPTQPEQMRATGVIGSTMCYLWLFR
jgi:3-methyladenine DNA glycosylase AlkD